MMEPQSFLPLPTATLHILIALGRGEKHGYALMRDVEELSDGALRMGRRRYYRLTGLGERVCAAEVQRLEALVRRAGSPDWAQRLVPRLGQA
jgi:DNA-binding PadR family transcriptional regulator